jgi:hypothetical protein
MVVGGGAVCAEDNSWNTLYTPRVVHGEQPWNGIDQQQL